jgi:hypothetical protein
LGSIIGAGRSKTNYWFQVFSHPHVIAFLCLLERLPERKRQELLQEFCRDLPSLDHPRLAHDPIGVTRLENILRQPAGLTLIRGGTEFQQTFLLTALGHSFQRHDGEHAKIAGLDIHEPRKWVPIETMTYFREPLCRVKLNQLVRVAWPAIAESGAKLVLLNGIWSVAPELQPEILKLAHQHQVVIADAKTPGPHNLPVSLASPVHVVKVGPAREHLSWIQTEVESI